MDKPEQFVMTDTNWKDWFHNAKLFAAPVIILYLTSVIGTISQDGHVFSVKDLYLTTFMQGGIVLYVYNTVLDWVRKWKGTS